MDRKGRLLVVEDDEDSGAILAHMLHREGFAVSTVADGPRALAAIAKEPVDLILLDIEMPGMNGFDVVQEVRRSFSGPALPIIITTARGDAKDVVTALGLGANDFVTKPLDFKIVLARVRSQLSHKQAIDRIVALEQDLLRQNAELEQANTRMRRGLEAASRMQKSLLPRKPLQIGNAEFAWCYQPCEELGGDILNVFPLGRRHVGFYLLDVSGHGVPAALLSVTLSRMLTPLLTQSSLVQQNGMNGPEPRPPRDVLEELNRRFQMSDESLQFFTIFYGLLDVVGRRLEYVNAGSPPALYIPGSGPPAFFTDCGSAIGWFENAQFEQGTLELQPGDRLYLYSDGCTETRDLDSQQFGRERLCGACCENREMPLQQSLDDLSAAISRFRGDAPITDDLSMLAFQFNA